MQTASAGGRRESSPPGPGGSRAKRELRADSTAAPAWHPPSGAGGSGEGRRRGWPNLWTLRPPPGWRLRSLFPPVGEEGGEWGWGAISFESEPMLGGAQSSVPGRRRGPRSVLHAAAGQRPGGGRLRSRPPHGKFFSTLPGWLDRGHPPSTPGLRNPCEQSLPPGLSALQQPPRVQKKR